MALNAVLCAMGGQGFDFLSVGGGYVCSRIVPSVEATGQSVRNQRHRQLNRATWVYS
jgi:hypothetical protein